MSSMEQKHRVGKTGMLYHFRVGETGVGETGVGEMGMGEMGEGEMGVGETGTPCGEYVAP